MYQLSVDNINYWQNAKSSIANNNHLLIKFLGRFQGFVNKDPVLGGVKNYRNESVMSWFIKMKTSRERVQYTILYSTLTLQVHYHVLKGIIDIMQYVVLYQSLRHVDFGTAHRRKTYAFVVCWNCMKSAFSLGEGKEAMLACLKWLGWRSKKWQKWCTYWHT